MEMAMKGILAVFWLILVPVAVGRLPFVKRRQPLLTERFVSGYLILFSIMEVLTLPMTFLKMPLHVLVISYGTIALILALTGVFVTVKAKDTIRLSGIFDREKIYFWIALILILAQMAMCVLLAHMDADDAFYVAQATSGVQTDTIFEIIPYTGQVLWYCKQIYTFSVPCISCGGKPAQCGTSSSDHGAYDFPGSFSSGSLQCSISSWKEMVSR